jgi:hypothetical protein
LLRRAMLVPIRIDLAMVTDACAHRHGGIRHHIAAMRKRRTKHALPGMLTSLGIASAQTIALRTAMIAAGTCSPAEYRRMVREKAAAALQSSIRAASWPPVSATALLAPWHSKATANAKRLRWRRTR